MAKPGCAAPKSAAERVDFAAAPRVRDDDAAKRAASAKTSEPNRRENETKSFVLDSESSLRRNRGEAGDFAVSSHFNRLAVFLFRLGENGARRSPIPQTGGRMAGGNGHGGNSDGEGTFYPEF